MTELVELQDIQGGEWAKAERVVWVDMLDNMFEVVMGNGWIAVYDAMRAVVWDTVYDVVYVVVYNAVWEVTDD